MRKKTFITCFLFSKVNFESTEFLHFICFIHSLRYYLQLVFSILTSDTKTNVFHLEFNELSAPETRQKSV